MHWFCSLILLPSLMAASAPPQDAPKEGIAQFQGTWKAVSIQTADGSRASEDDVRNTRLVVDQDRFTLTGKGFTVSGTFTVNATAIPKSIDVLLTTKDRVETRFLGIYQIQGDTRRSCFALPGKERPKQFTTEKEYFGFEWRRY